MLTISSTEFRRASHQPPGQGSLVKQTTTPKSSKRVVFQRGAAETFLESEGWQMLFGR